MKPPSFWFWLVGFICIVTLVTKAEAVPILIDFEADAPGAKPNGFTPVGVPGVHFTDTVGAGLEVGNFGPQGGNTNALAVFTDFDNSALRIDLDFLADAFSFDYGNDDPGFSQPGDEVFLTLFLNNVQVGQVSQVMNRNDVMDQNLGLAGILFNEAVIKYDVNPEIGLIELVDNIRINQVPVPSTLLLLGLGLAIAGVRKKQNATKRLSRPNLRGGKTRRPGRAIA
jgi:hypothetical protein